MSEASTSAIAEPEAAGRAQLEFEDNLLLPLSTATVDFEARKRLALRPSPRQDR